MGKLIAVCGGPFSGKTTLAIKLAQGLYSMNRGCPVIYMSPDISVPVLGYVFPRTRDVELRSVGKAFDKTDIYPEDVMRQFVNVRSMRNFAYLGFKLGENRYSYPTPTEDKVLQFIKVLRELADYVIIECTCEDDDLISGIVKRDCDIAVQIYNPDFRSMVYHASCVNEFLPIEDKRIRVMNVMDRDIYLPVDKVTEHFGAMDVTLPYSGALKKQMITGTLSEPLKDKGYIAGISKLAGMVM